MAKTATRSTQSSDAEKLVRAVAVLEALVERFKAEGQDEMFLADLDRLVSGWATTAEYEAETNES